ncbi:MAG: tRNA methyltransferase ppm2 [Bogoriella megaspora]|nr:MAG: tRNA methyltransferase ppm2 [Bogoriella megaspora]
MQRRDESVMETNNSCIVSKRSVEKLYYAGDPEFIRYFVTKFQRRSPLINRGYWLHIDYPALIRRKRDIIVNTDPLVEALHGLNTQCPQDALFIRSEKYLALGCDLKQINDITKLLEEQLDIQHCSVLFVAEVAITYMEPEDADSVIRWASQFGNARFCLLEQHLPCGADHPFAQTMLQHFQKLQSPLRVLNKYPEIKDQKPRFTQNGWANVNVTDLWSLWSDTVFITADQRSVLDAIEPFDEWEELALFGGHYFLLVADTNLEVGMGRTLTPASQEERTPRPLPSHDARMLCKTYSKGQGYRRFGAAMTIQQDAALPDIIGYHGGLGQQSRLASCDIYTDIDLSGCFRGPPSEAIMNHTITYHRDSKYLFVGGRSSPNKAHADCWLQADGLWERTDDLLPGRYRHCAVQARLQLTSSRMRTNGVLVFAGKTSDSKVLGEWMFWDGHHGWQEISVLGDGPEARFGASMWSTSKTSQTWGYVTGGMRKDGTIIQDLWKWEVVSQQGILKIACSDLTEQVREAGLLTLFGRFGANLLKTEWGILLVGGITAGLPLKQEDEFLILGEKPEKLIFSRLETGIYGPRPLLVGTGVTSVQYHGVVLLGGGATCFSFGTYWNVGCYTLTATENHESHAWHIDDPALQNPIITGSAGIEGKTRASAHYESPDVPSISHLKLPDSIQIQRLRLGSPEDFQQVVEKAEPVIIEDLDIGDCTSTWSTQYLKDKIGSDRPVVVHSSSEDHMNFRNKNFKYVNVAFGKFMDDIRDGAKYYLRAISSTKPTKQVTNLQDDYPEIAADFRLPPELRLVTTQIHSSPLRISGPVAMWLHYDVMANVLCQIRGYKKLILFPPSDVRHLNFSAGASSSEINVFKADVERHPSLVHTHPHEILLKPGDVLFIPAFWMHAAAPTDGLSIAVNVFFRNLDKGYAIGRDVYGNRDLQPYEKGRQDIGKLVKSFDGLPKDVRSFYLQRLADELDECIDS